MEPKKETSCIEFLLTLAMGLFVATGTTGGVFFLLEKAGVVMKW